jgi:hypothetical protein
MRWFLAELVCVVCACVATPALAVVRADDAAVTRAYLRAADAYERGLYAEMGARVAAMEARASQIAGGCRSALTYAPRDEAFGELGEEFEATVFFAGVAPVRSRLLRLADAIGHLRWSDRRLTRLVRVLAAEERAAVALALPDVCADIAAWRASAYAVLPLSATRFLARLAAIESLSSMGSSKQSTEVSIMRRLRPYEGRAERRTARRIERLEAQVGRRVAVASKAADEKLSVALGVSTP